MEFEKILEMTMFKVKEINLNDDNNENNKNENNENKWN